MSTLTNLRAPSKRSLVGAALTAVLCATGIGANAADKVDVVTSSTGFLYVTAYIAKQMSYFEGEGLDVSITDGGGGSNAVAAVVGGSADIGVVGIRNMSEAVKHGVPMKAIGTGINGFPLALVVRSELVKPGFSEDAPLSERMALLKGGTVAVLDVGGSSGGFVRYLLSQAGLPKDHLTIINLNSNAGQLASLKAGRIDGFVNTSPIWETALADGYGMDLVLPSRDIPSIGDMTYIIQAARTDYVDANRDTVRKYLRGIRRAQLLVQNEPQKAKQAFFDYLASLSSAEPMADNVKDIMWEQNEAAIPRTLAIQPAGMKAARTFFKIDAATPDEALIDNTIATQVEAEVR